jgi:flagellar biogenesis protein FliO
MLLCSRLRTALAVAVALVVWPQPVESSPPPLPEWQDGVSVYLTTQAADERPVGFAQEPRLDPAIEPAVATVEPAPTASDDKRRLAPPSSSDASRTKSFASRESLVPSFNLPLDSAYSTAAALALVVGLFLLFAWVLRRGVRRTSGLLPSEVVGVVGRVQLSAKQYAELLRVGNKLVLVSLTPSGADTITEVTDPAEVDRLLGLCQQYDPHSTTKAFEQVFRQLTRERTPDGMFSDKAAIASPSTADGFRTQLGDLHRA